MNKLVAGREFPQCNITPFHTEAVYLFKEHEF